MMMDRQGHEHCEAVISSLERERDAMHAALRQLLALVGDQPTSNIVFDDAIATLRHWAR